MMLASVTGACPVAPRQSGLKKPRPMRSLSAQEEVRHYQNVMGSLDKCDFYDRNQIDFSQIRTLSLDGDQTRNSSQSGDQAGLPVCKEIVALSSRLFALDSDTPDKVVNRRPPIHRQNSVSSGTPVYVDRRRHSSGSGHFDDVCLPWMRESPTRCVNVCLNRATAGADVYLAAPSQHLGSALASSVNYNPGCGGRARHSSATNSIAGDSDTLDKVHGQRKPSTELTKVTLVTPTEDELTLSGKNMKTALLASKILLRELKAKLVKIDFQNDQENGRVKQTDEDSWPDETENRNECVTPEKRSHEVALGTNKGNNSVTPDATSHEAFRQSGACCFNSTDQLQPTVIQQLPSVIQQLPSVIQQLPSVIQQQPPVIQQQPTVTQHAVAQCPTENQLPSPTQESLHLDLTKSCCEGKQYSKDELLELSTSCLSHKPPSEWNAIARSLDCCLPVNKVTQYFEPSKFAFHDGSLVVQSPRER